MKSKIELSDAKNGFSERDLHSKAILNKDCDMLLKYKIQKNRMNNMASSLSEIETVKSEIQSLKSEMSEIKNILLKLVTGKTCQ